MKRREFIKTSSVGSGISLMPKLLFGSHEIIDEKEEAFINPPKIKKDDLIGLLCPSGPLIKGREQKAILQLNELGFRTKFSKNYLAKKGFLAGTDEQRLNDLHSMFQDKEVKAIVCLRGGYGTMRLLSHIDYDLIRKNPKLFIGFSDITALLYAFYQKAKLITYHGPVGVWDINSFSKHSFLHVLQSNRSYTIKAPQNQAITTLKKGIAEGHIIGGNLSLMSSLIGTPYDVSFKNKIIFIEDIGEEPYRIDRMFAQLFLAKKFERVKGIIFGQFFDCFAKRSKKITHEGVDGSFIWEKIENFNTVNQVIQDWFGSFSIPILMNFPIGHVSNNATVPFGGRVTLDANNQSLHIHSLEFARK